MGTIGHTIAVGDILQASINGESRLLTVTRADGHGVVHTDDWRCWWYRQPDHQDGHPVVESECLLFTDRPALVQEPILEGVAA
jgi:hypothetical protein